MPLPALPLVDLTAAFRRVRADRGPTGWCISWLRASSCRTRTRRMKISARHQISARVSSINRGEAIANVELDASGVRLVASVTVEAVQELGLAEGTAVTALVKASDVILAVEA
jgi:molybdopterin-binding protein